MRLPILIAHAGYAPYLEFTLRQAVDRAGRDGVVFLGDASNDRFPFVRFVDGDQPVFREAAARIAEVYRHASTNTRAFELSAIQRWFQLHALMVRDGIDRALVLDSDVLLYASPAEMDDWLGEAQAGLAIPDGQPAYGWEASGHSAFWTVDALGDWCDYAVRAYTDPAESQRLEAKWRHHQTTGTPGGICDMALFYLWAERQPAGTVRGVTEARGGIAFDHNVAMTLGSVPGEYELAADGIKRLSWRGGHPYALRSQGGAWVRHFTLHLQGPSKGRMGDLYRGPDFPARAALAVRLRRVHRARALGGRLKYALWSLAGRLRR